MSRRVRPSFVRNIPVLAFCLLGGFLVFGVDDVPAVVRIFGAMFALAFVPFLLLLITTWFEFGDDVVRSSTLGRVREFHVEDSTLRMHPLAVGFFGESTVVELRSEEGRRTMSLAVISPDDRELVKRELRSRFKSPSTG